MAKNRNYRPIKEILTVFQINQNTADIIIKKHKIDCFGGNGKLMVNIKDFYKAYTKNFNPSLFDLPNTKKHLKVIENFIKGEDLFNFIFSKGYKANTKKNKIIAKSLLIY